MGDTSTSTGATKTAPTTPTSPTDSSSCNRVTKTLTSSSVTSRFATETITLASATLGALAWRALPSRTTSATAKLAQPTPTVAVSLLTARLSAASSAHAITELLTSLLLAPPSSAPRAAVDTPLPPVLASSTSVPARTVPPLLAPLATATVVPTVRLATAVTIWSTEPVSLTTALNGLPQELTMMRCD